MDANAIKTRFLDLLKQFSKDIANAYGNDKNDLQTMHSSLLIVANAFPDTVCQVFHTHVAQPYGDKINARDEAFFMSPDLDSEVAMRECPVDPMPFIKHLRSVWAYLNNDDKNNVWMYMHALVTLSNKIRGRV